MVFLRFLVVGLVVVVVTSVSLEAQITPPPPVPVTLASDFGACLVRDAPLPTDPDHPDQPQGIGGFQSPMTFVRNALVCAEAYGGAVMAQSYGWPLFRWLSLIVVVWTGVTMMFAGRFEFSEALSLILLILFLGMILMSYQDLAGPLIGDPIWGDDSFPLLIASLGRTVADPLVEGVWEAISNEWTQGLFVYQTEAALAQTLNLRQRAYICRVSPEECGPQTENLASGFVFTLIFILFFGIAIIFGAIPLLVAYFSYVWGYFSLVIVTLVGPLLVPWGLLPQTQFLFWGWVRSIIAATFQMMIGGAVFVVSGTLLLTPLRRYTNSLKEMLAESQDLAVSTVLSQGFSMVLEFLPLALIAILGAFKGGEITGMILSGGGVPSSGLGDRTRGAGQAKSAAMGAARGVRSVASAGAAVASGGATAAASAGSAVLSAATKKK